MRTHHCWFMAVTMVAFALSTTALAQAQLRSPQVPVSGTGLQSLFATLGEQISVQTDQRSMQSFQPLAASTPGTLAFEIHPVAPTPVLLATYNTDVASPVLRTVVFENRPAGWFTAVSYRSATLQQVVIFRDPALAFQGAFVYPDVHLLAQGFAIPGVDTTWSEDGRNPGGQPRMLFFRGTGANSGDAYLCAEVDGDQDFDDAVYRLQFFAPTPTRRDSWSRVKQLYR